MGQNETCLEIAAQNKKERLSANVVLVAVGIVPNTEGLGLESLGVRKDKGFVVTDKTCSTSVSNIFAIGDMTSPPWLAHKASHEGIIVAEVLARSKRIHTLKKVNIPGCVYSSPQIASFGLTEEEAVKDGHKIKVGNFPFVANGKALAMAEEDGFVKTIFDENSGELLGAHMVGAEVTELISTLLVGSELETTSEELINTIFPHPTISEILHESVLSAEGKVIHF